jgi:hypothetical protein
MEAKERVLLLSEPFRGFIKVRCEVQQGSWIDIDVLYGEYVLYCAENGSHPLARNKFGESLMTNFPGIKHSRRGRAGGAIVQIYTGVRLNDERVAAVYRMDPVMEDLGAFGYAATQRDENDGPIPRTSAARDFSDTVH